MVGPGEAMAKTSKPAGVTVHHANNWDRLTALVDSVQATLPPKAREALWFRGTSDEAFELAPTLMRATAGLSVAEHDSIEQDLFFEFQARSADLRFRNLS